MKPHSGQQVNK